mgnify:CR=1 FL=1
MQSIKVLIADDNGNFIQQVKSFLASDPDIEIVGEAKDGKEAISKVKELTPDIVLMDVRMPKMSGLKATHRIKQIMPEVKIIILTIYDIDEYRKAAKDSGASNFVVKTSIKNQISQNDKRGV